MKKNVVLKQGKNFLDLKVYHNKNNGQGIIMLPKKKFGGQTPKKVRILW